MKEFSKGDFVKHPRHGSIILTVVSPPALNNNESMVAEYGTYFIAITDSPSKFSLVENSDKA